MKLFPIIAYISYYSSESNLIRSNLMSLISLSNIQSNHSSWICSSCTFENDTITRTCKMCFNKRTSSESSSNSWQCGICTYENNKINEKCEMCDSFRPDSDPTDVVVNNQIIDSKKTGTERLMKIIGKTTSKKEDGLLDVSANDSALDNTVKCNASGNPMHKIKEACCDVLDSTLSNDKRSSFESERKPINWSNEVVPDPRISIDPRDEESCHDDYSENSSYEFDSHDEYIDSENNYIDEEQYHMSYLDTVHQDDRYESFEESKSKVNRRIIGSKTMNALHDDSIVNMKDEAIESDFSDIISEDLKLQKRRCIPGTIDPRNDPTSMNSDNVFPIQPSFPHLSQHFW